MRERQAELCCGTTHQLCESKFKQAVLIKLSCCKAQAPYSSSCWYDNDHRHQNIMRKTIYSEVANKSIVKACNKIVKWYCFRKQWNYNIWVLSKLNSAHRELWSWLKSWTTYWPWCIFTCSWGNAHSFPALHSSLTSQHPHPHSEDCRFLDIQQSPVSIANSSHANVMAFICQDKEKRITSKSIESFAGLLNFDLKSIIFQISWEKISPKQKEKMNVSIDCIDWSLAVWW